MQSIVATHYGFWRPVQLPQALPSARCTRRPKRRRSQCRRIPEGAPAISGRKRKPIPRGGRDHLPIGRQLIDRHTGIATGVAAGCAGGSVAAAGAAGGGCDAIRRR